MKKIGLLILLLNLNAVKTHSQIPAKKLPDYRFFLQNHKSFTPASQPAGKMSFFFFFDSGCDHCQLAVTELNKKYNSFKSVEVYLVSIDSWEKINHFIKNYGPALSHQKNVILLRDSLNQFITKFQPRRYPAMFLYSADKKIMDYEDTPEAVFRFERLIDITKPAVKPI